MTRKQIHPAEQYALDVREGRIPVCRYMRLAVERYFRDRAEAVERGWHFDERAAKRPIDFIQCLRHIKGEWAGQTISLEPWQQFFLWNLFGFKRADNGFRRFREAYLEVARKNGKTTLLAGIGLYMLFADGEAGSEVYSCATTRDQARVCFDAAQQMVQHSTLSRRAKIFRSAGGSIAYEANGSVFKPLSSDANTLDGKNAYCTIVDEFHAHKTGEVYAVMKSSMGARRQPLMCIITTAGFNLAGPCFTYRSSAVKMLEGIIEDDSTLAMIYTQDSREELADPKMWVKSNPCYGASVNPEYIEEQYHTLRTKPEQESSILTKNFNMWVQASDVWIGDDVWRASQSLTDVETLKGCECYAGLDLGSVNDYSALVLEFHENNRTQVLPFFWIPEEKYRSRREMMRENANIDAWVRAGYITVTPGNVTDYGFIRQAIGSLAEMYNIRKIGYDRWNSSQLVIDLLSDGVPMDGFQQSIGNMSPPTKDFERIVRLGEYEHFGNPVLRWQVSNVVIYRDANDNIKPVKNRSPEKIDGVVAAIIAHGEWMSAQRTPEAPSVYEERGLRFL